MTNPVALPKPASKDGDKASNSSRPPIQYYQGNIQLLEARYLQLCTSIRALYGSVEQLREFCKAQPETAAADRVIVEAVFENLGVLRKQRTELVSVVKDMQALHADTNLPDDIRIMVLGNEKEEKADADTGSGDAGVYL